MCRLGNLGTSDSTGIDPSGIPDDQLSQAAYKHVKTHLHPSILAHSMRVFFYAKTLSERENKVSPQQDPCHGPSRLPVLFTACMFHDFGSTALHDDKPGRFEVEGGDAAADFLQQHGFSAADAHEVWVAIACHTSPQIGERVSELGRLIRLGPLCDFHRGCPEYVPVVSEPLSDDKLFVLESDRTMIEEILPRNDIEQALGSALIAQAQKPGMRGKAPNGSWSGDLVKAAELYSTREAVDRAFF